ncbi:MAG TPA: hypothetical protein VF121_01330 [Thermoanaerobaculia bacterium]|nr:hypothetical protein [Thermoanaerobaculia bacterium]
MRLPRLVLLFGALALPAAADDVHLTNGNSFEGVIAEVTETQVRIRMPGGELSLPKSVVARVEKGAAPFAEFLAREEALRRDPDATARDWVELARWAQARGLATASRDAALVAAKLDPHLDALEPLLRAAGFVYDRELERWVPYAESMRRRGFVQVGAAWITRAEHEARQRAQERAEQERRQRRAEAIEAARAARTARLLDLAEVQLVRDMLEPRPMVVPVGVGWPLVVLPGFFPPVVDRPDPPGGGGHPGLDPRPDPRFPPRDGRSSRLPHQPGSLIPGDYQPISATGSRSE